MKIRSLLVAASVSMLSFSAFAGGNCIYGHDSKIAQSEADDNGVLYDEAAVDPGLLALLRKQQSKQDKLVPIPTFN